MSTATKTLLVAGAAGLTLLGARKAYQMATTPAKSKLNMAMAMVPENMTTLASHEEERVESDAEFDKKGENLVEDMETNVIIPAEALPHHAEMALNDLCSHFNKSLTTLMCDGTSDEEYNRNNRTLLKKLSMVLRSYQSDNETAQDLIRAQESENRMVNPDRFFAECCLTSTNPFKAVRLFAEFTPRVLASSSFP